MQKQLYGKQEERAHKVIWMEANMLCSDCYKAQKIAEDAKANKFAKICLIPASEPIISIEVTGQIEANKEAFYKLGYKWSDSHEGGLMNYLSMARPQRALALVYKIESVEEFRLWMAAQSRKLEKLGYFITQAPTGVDEAYLVNLLTKKESFNYTKQRAKDTLEDIKKSDPRPKTSPLREKIIKIERETNTKWNGKIYGSKGEYSFYVANKKYWATDTEIEEREKINAAIDVWDEKYKYEILAAKD